MDDVLFPIGSTVKFIDNNGYFTVLEYRVTDDEYEYLIQGFGEKTTDWVTEYELEIAR